MIQLIASDMDGTLLGNKMEVMPENIEAIRFAEEKGITFMVATGRGYTEAKPPLDDAGIKCGMITGNGAQAFDAEGNLLFSIPIEELKVREIIALLNEHDVYYEMAANTGIFSDSQVKRIENAAISLAEALPHLTFKMAIAMASAHLELLNVEYVDSYDELLEDPEVEILKLFVVDQAGSEKLKPIQKEIEALGGLTVTSSFDTNIEINHIDAQKGKAVAHIARELDIPLENVMTIGDGFNDISMLETAGVSFAMSNGADKVKETAKYQAEKNTHNGVAKAIRKAIDENL